MQMAVAVAVRPQRRLRRAEVIGFDLRGFGHVFFCGFGSSGFDLAGVGSNGFGLGGFGFGPKP